MTAISSETHRQFVTHIQRIVLSLKENEVQQKIEKEINLLQQFYDEYQQHLSLLRELVMKYEEVQRVLRKETRKSQIRQKWHYARFTGLHEEHL